MKLTKENLEWYIEYIKKQKPKKIVFYCPTGTTCNGIKYIKSCPFRYYCYFSQKD